jgi:hypothetical protein
MQSEFRAGRLTPSQYIVALEDEIDRLAEAYELAASQATENAIAAVRAMLQLEHEREIAQHIQDELTRIIHEAARRVREMREHPAGRSYYPFADGADGEAKTALRVVKEAD